MLIAQRERALLARRADLPFAEPMGRDERVEHDGYPVRRERPLRWLAAHTSLEVRHHLMDVRRQLGVDAEAGTDAEAGRSM